MAIKITKELVAEVNERVFHYFKEVGDIPRGSGNEKAIADYLVEFAKKYGFESTRSAENEYMNGKKTNNVVIFKPATVGYEKCKPVIIQSHNDMVCEKRKDSKHDFEKDPIDYKITEQDGIKVMKANSTTLGGDNGIGMAYTLAILERNDLAHPEINALFTSDEEAGMSGAIAVTAELLKGVDNKCLINVDTEEEGVLFNGCAGGIDANFRMPVNYERTPGDYAFIRIEISGLLGGHSGIDIHRKRANAHILMARTLRAIEDNCPVRIVEFKGGTMRNAITREVSVLVAVPYEKIDSVTRIVRQERDVFAHEYRYIEIDKDGKSNIALDATVELCELKCSLSRESTSRLINAIMVIPNGVLEMLGKEEDMDLVETSSNLGIVRLEFSHAFLCSFVRSFVRTRKFYVVEQMKSLANLIGAEFTVAGDSPNWEPETNSELKERFSNAYKAIFGVEPEIKSVHAGLECGYFAQKFPGMDMISCGPTLKWVHTPDEIMYVDTVIKVTELLLNVLNGMDESVVLTERVANGVLHEDVIIVRNEMSMVLIKDVEITGDMEFELLHDGAWIKGCRQNSRYGQIFVGDGVTQIIVSGQSRGRVYV
jgi:dipeptidase D